jgi:hypothetical protein
VRDIVEQQYQRAQRILRENKDKLTALAEQLLVNEVIYKEDLEKIFGDRPFGRDPHASAALPSSPNGSTTTNEPAAPASGSSVA